MGTTEVVETSCRLRKLVLQFIDEKGWDAAHSSNAEPRRTSSVAFVDHCDQTYQVFLETYPDREWLLVFIYTPYAIMASSIGEAKLLTSYINSGLANGWIAVRDGGGAFQFRQVIDAEGAQLTTKVIDNMVLAGLGLLEGWMPALAAVALSGVGADEAIGSTLRHYGEERAELAPDSDATRH